jgi:hypothetical protein
MRNRSAIVVVLIVIAVAGIAKVGGQIRTVDLVQLTGSGMCLGVAIMLAVRGKSA